MRDMYRSDWMRITQREYISRPCTVDSLPGAEALIVMKEITAPLIVHSTEIPVKIVERGYSWLQRAAEGANVWLTAMFDENDNLFQIYFDITAGNVFDHPDNPCFRDMYLDVVVRGDGKIFVLDQDELDEALEKGEITQAEYDMAQSECKALVEHLRENMGEVLARCIQSQKELKTLLNAQ